MSAEFSLLIKRILHGPVQQASQQQIISDGLSSYSYVEFIDRVNRFGQLLERFGLEQGDVVAIMDWAASRRSSLGTAVVRRRMRPVRRAATP